MRLLLDTCTFLWLAAEPERVSERVREAFERPQSEVLLSTASAWEIAVKHGLGRLPLPAPPERFVPELRAVYGVATLGIEEEAALRMHQLPDLHRDPFDRMLVAQAIVHGLVLATPDPDIARYPVRSLW